MPYLEWKPSFSVGFERFDAENRHLVSLLNRLHSNLANQNTMSILGVILKELEWYTRWHFSAEEMHMQAHAYPNFTSHKLEHDRFKKQIDWFVDHFQWKRYEIAVEVCDALETWLTEHILQRDVAYASFFEFSGIADKDFPPFAGLPTKGEHLGLRT